MKVIFNNDSLVSTAARMSACRANEWFLLSDSLLGSCALTCFWHRLWYLSTFRNPWFNILWQTKSIRLQTYGKTEWERILKVKTSSKKGIYICIYITHSLCCAAETNTTLLSNYTPIKINKGTSLVIQLLRLHPCFQCKVCGFNPWSGN